MKALSSHKISVLALVLLITGAIDSIRNLPTTALFGSSLIFFFIFSAIIFLIPVALVSAELSSTMPEEEGGVYSWVKHAFGDNVAFLPSGCNGSTPWSGIQPCCHLLPVRWRI